MPRSAQRSQAYGSRIGQLFLSSTILFPTNRGDEKMSCRPGIAEPQAAVNCGFSRSDAAWLARALSRHALTASWTRTSIGRVSGTKSTS